jgi:enediyne biosynthesis protein E4
MKTSAIENRVLLRLARVKRSISRLCLITAACASASSSNSPAAAPPSAVVFKDRTAELGLALSGDGACWADFNNDGWVDLCAGGVVWRNNAGKSFTRIAETGAAVAADFDNDGYVDLFSWSRLRLYRNLGGTNFVEVKMPPLPQCVSRGACWGDFNGDGFVDLYIGGFEDWNAGITYPSMILMNSNGVAFHLAWTDSRYRARGVTACDFDRDGDLDVYVSNYRLQPNLLWLNDGTGRFKDVAAAHNVVATSPGFEGGHSIGAAWGDFNNDGQIDLFAGNFAHVDDRGDQPKSRFLRNLGPEKSYTFQDMGPCGIFYQESYASPAAGDYDNDGNLDLFFTTIYGTASFSRKNYPVLFHNEGHFVFSDGTAAAKLSELGATYQAAWGDFDNDGHLDLVTAGRLFRNEGSTNHWIKVCLTGDGRAVNRSAIGAQVRAKLKDRTLTRQVEAGTGEGNQNDLTLHFGLGSQAEPVEMEIFWPNGKTQTTPGAAPDGTISVRFKPIP